MGLRRTLFSAMDRQPRWRRQALCESVPGYLPSGQAADLVAGAGKDARKKESRSAS
ncbi:MAG: hypothetical protein P8X61_03685 [Limibacillus sp.]|jgi:hypothetical protein